MVAYPSCENADGFGRKIVAHRHTSSAINQLTKDEANPRFVVTSLTRAECKARYLDEKVYCARGDMVG